MQTNYRRQDKLSAVFLCLNKGGFWAEYGMLENERRAYANFEN